MLVTKRLVFLASVFMFAYPTGGHGQTRRNEDRERRLWRRMCQMPRSKAVDCSCFADEVVKRLPDWYLAAFDTPMTKELGQREKEVEDPIIDEVSKLCAKGKARRDDVTPGATSSSFTEPRTEPPQPPWSKRFRGAFLADCMQVEAPDKVQGTAWRECTCMAHYAQKRYSEDEWETASRDDLLPVLKKAEERCIPAKADQHLRAALGGIE